MHEYLGNLAQGESTSNLEPIVPRLLHHSLFSSKDKGVKILTCCCIADILRLFAPEAPYSSEQLAGIFKLFVQELRNVCDTASAYFSYYFYLLESLATVRTVVLVLDVSNSDQLVVKIFKNFLADIPSCTSKEVRLFFLEILKQLIEESDLVSLDLIEFLVNTVEKEERSTYSYCLALDTLAISADKIQPQICQIFTEKLSVTQKWNEDFISNFKLAHDLIVVLGEASLDLLINVFPILEEEIAVLHI